MQIGEIEIIGSIRDQYDAGAKKLSAGDTDFIIHRDFASEDELIDYCEEIVSPALWKENIESTFSVSIDLNTDFYDGITTINGAEVLIYNDYRDWEIKYI